jgi:hypothetical protein
MFLSQQPVVLLVVLQVQVVQVVLLTSGPGKVVQPGVGLRQVVPLVISQTRLELVELVVPPVSAVLQEAFQTSLAAVA